METSRRKLTGCQEQPAGLGLASDWPWYYQISFPDICKSRTGVPGPLGPFPNVPKSMLVGSVLKPLFQLGWLRRLKASRRVCRVSFSFQENRFDRLASNSWIAATRTPVNSIL